MKTILHVIMTTSIFLTLWWFIEAITISSIILGIAIHYLIDATVDPEKGMTNYGMYFSHSQIIWIFVFIFNPIHILAMVILSISIHDMTDIYPSNPDISRRRYNSWLLVNCLVGIIIFLLFLMM